MYAKKLTKEDLIRDGINDIKADGTVIRNGYQITLHKNNHGYLGFNIYDYDENGERIKIDKKRSFAYNTANGPKQTKKVDTYVYKIRMIGLHRAMWAWYYGEVPEGYVVDHISNKHDSLEDYRLENLQLLTPKANLAKERVESTKQIKCKMNKPRSFYENKLKHYEELYESAKLNKAPKVCHKLRTNIANTRARLRYWDAHKEEYEEFVKGELAMKTKTEFQKDLMELASWKKYFKENDNKRLWHECCKIEKIVKVKGEEAWPIVKHALEVCHTHFGG